MKQRVEQINLKMAKEHGLIDEEEVSYEKARSAIINPENFTKRIESSDIEISPGVRLGSQTIELGAGNFTNLYDVYFNKNDATLSTQIITKQQPIYQHKLFSHGRKNTSTTEKPIACINGTFFFLEDGKLDKVPSEVIYNLNIRDGKTVGLPSIKRPSLFVTKDGKIHARELEANGTVLIGGREIFWTGGEPIAHNRLDKTEETMISGAVLYNSACCSIEYEDPKDKKSLRKLRQDLNATPKKGGVTDVVVSADKTDKLYVTSINQGGGTDFFKGNFILQIQSSELKDVKIGDEVDPKTLGNLNINEIKSAVTTGPAVDYFRNNDDHEINHDLSLGSFPPFDANARYARSVMYEDSASNIHMVVFDAVPRSEHMKGVTPKEVAEHIPKDTKWAVFLDGGQSSRITFESSQPNEKDVEVEARGNKQYVRLHKRDKKSQTAEGEGQFLWTTRGRPLSSLIALYRHKSS